MANSKTQDPIWRSPVSQNGGIDGVARRFSLALTSRARARLSGELRQLGIPAFVDGHLLRFHCAGMVARVEVLLARDPLPSTHFHITLSAPALAAPVVICQSTRNPDLDPFFSDASSSWAKGFYQSCEAALSSASRPTDRIGDWEVFESWLPELAKGSGACPHETASSPCTWAASYVLSEDKQMDQGRIHTLTYGKHPLGRGGSADAEDGAAEPSDMRLDGPIRVEDSEALFATSYAGLPPSTSAPNQRICLLRRGTHWPALDSTAGLRIAARYHLELAQKDFDAGQLQRAESSLIHALELAGTTALAVDLLGRWAEATAGQASRGQGSVESGISQLYLDVYQAMARSDAHRSLRLLRRLHERTPLDNKVLHLHWRGLARLYGELELPAPRAEEVGYSPNERRGQQRPTEARFNAALGQLAAMPFTRNDWRVAARSILRHIPRPDARALLASAAYPEVSPYPNQASEWNFKLHCAASFLVAQWVIKEGLESRSGRALVGALDGPAAPSTTAAALGLTEVGLACPGATRGVIEELSSRLQAQPTPQWRQYFSDPCTWLLLKLPKLDPVLQESLESHLDRHFSARAESRGQRRDASPSADTAMRATY